MSGYVSNIVFGIASFPLIAFLITLPYLLYQYRKFGSIPWLRTLVVYSFVFYLLVAYYMVILPLPADRTAVVPYAAHPQLVPFEFVRGFLASSTFSPSDPSTWLATLKNPYVYEAFFNVLLLVPLGMYLRYYFRRTWWQTLLIGFATTLFYETSQITGLWGLYEHPYRLFDVDDLMLNTLGAMAGFWIMGPLMRWLPDFRLVDEEAREAGLRAGALRRALSFACDLVAASAAAGIVLGAAQLLGAREAAGDGWPAVESWTRAASCLAFFVAVPSAAHGQTLGQRLLRLRIVRADASPARWYQYLARYGLLYLLAVLPFAALNGIVSLDAPGTSELGAVSELLQEHQVALVWIWLAFMGAWGVTLVARAVHAAAVHGPFVMLNGMLSGTRVMTVDGVEQERERRAALDVAEVAALEQALAEAGTPLSELMERAGGAVADAVRLHVPDPAPVTVLAGAGNNGGDGWTAARSLAESGYPVTLVAPDLAERLRAEPARSTAQAVFADAAERGLPLRVLIAPEADVLADALDGAAAVVDAMLGTGFSGQEVREPYASWIEAANRRRFEGARGKGRGRHRKRAHERGDHERPRKCLPEHVKDAPFAVAADVPSGLSAQTGQAARPCFAADVTVTMLAFKPGLACAASQPWTGTVRLAKLVDGRPGLDGRSGSVQE